MSIQLYDIYTLIFNLIIEINVLKCVRLILKLPDDQTPGRRQIANNNQSFHSSHIFFISLISCIPLVQKMQSV